jgi:hypothetical protein
MRGKNGAAKTPRNEDDVASRASKALNIWLLWNKDRNNRSLRSSVGYIKLAFPRLVSICWYMNTALKIRAARRHTDTLSAICGQLGDGLSADQPSGFRGATQVDRRTNGRSKVQFQQPDFHVRWCAPGACLTLW